MNFEYEKLKIILGSGETLTPEEMLLAVNRVLAEERKQQMSEIEKGLGVPSELTVRQLCCAAYSKIDYGDGVLQNLDGKTAKEIFDQILVAYARDMVEKESEIKNLKSLLRGAIASRCSCEFRCYWYDWRNNKCLRNNPKNPCPVWPSRVALGEEGVNGK